MPKQNRDPAKVEAGLKAQAEKLITMRTEAGFTQEQAANFVYVSLRTYQNWEYGLNRIPQASLELFELKAIARGLIKRPPELHEQTGKE